VSATAELQIDSIAAGGDGVARAEQLVVFVPRSAPGDRARVRYQSRGRFARGEIVQLLDPGSGRIDPPCLHYTADRCGGCQLQHIAYDAQLSAKTRIVSDAFQRIAKLDTPVAPTIASPEAWRYRRKLTLALRRRGDTWIAGLHPYDAPGHIFALRDCPISDTRVMSCWREVMAAAEMLPDAHELRGAVRLSEDPGTDGAAFMLEGATSWDYSEAFFARVPSLMELWWVPEGQGRRLLHRRGKRMAAGGSFVQVNAGVASLISAAVIAECTARRPATVVDAYAGTGDVAAQLAADGARVTAIESDPNAAAACAARLPDGSRMVVGRVEDALGSALPADLVVLNPPRIGVDQRVTDALNAAPPAALIYVSCNPATLARDVARLRGFGVHTVQPFDMFPQTAHVETLCVLERTPHQGEEAP
jgi:23S rRNA (uracil1939-C5)-methyltransferase